ncbi:class I SAM-dependent methyltransferase [Streptosporangium jomthongense]|uniref:Class I SAM-dependent methyltransferase n=1 Tax=Streptosporangium jomthongense TaxID=1193683 RepID=A0ABV8EZD2_9ACTN
MTSNTTRQDAAVADKAILAGHAYADERHLAARQSIYRWQHPRYDLPGIVTEELAAVTGAVADIGCGNGKFLTHLRARRPDLNIVGLDLSAGILTHLPPPVLVADAQTLPFADHSIDAVLAMHMLYHVTDVPSTITEIARVLRPGGLLIASTNSDTDKHELDRLWSTAAGHILGLPEGPARVSLSSRFSLEKAPAYLAEAFTDIHTRHLPGTITLTDPAPITAHLASYEAWAHLSGVPFHPTIRHATDLAAAVIETEGAFTITCHGGILTCRTRT